MVKELKVLALIENLDKVLKFLEDCLNNSKVNIKKKTLLYIACEEIFINISKYAYKGVGEVKILFEYANQGKEVKVTFIDSGVKFDPTIKKNPDISLSAEDRQIGGLGIYMVKKTVDDLIYSYINGKNHLTLVKKID